MAELAARPGAYPLHWERGPVTLPPSLSQAAGPKRALRCSVWSEGGRLHVTVDAPESATREAVLDAVRAQLINRDAEREREQPLYTLANYSLVASDAASSPKTADDAGPDPILRALTSMSEQRGTVAELSKQVGWSATKIRSRLRSLEEAGEVEVDRSGRTHVFSLIGAIKSSSPKQAPRSQLELLSS